MKKKIFLGLGLILLAFVGWVGYGLAFPKSPKASISFTEGDVNIIVSYSQPSKRGRVIFGDEASGALQPYGQYWRLGANAPTEITFNKNVTFAGEPVSAGTYSMYAVPGAVSFQISLNSKIGSFSGAPKPDYALDVIKVNIPVAEVSETEKFTITFDKVADIINMDLIWDKTQIRVPITIQ